MSTPAAPGLIRPLNPQDAAEVALVARRMRDTLVEVEGAQRGGSMYTLDWLEARVRWHLDPAACTAAVWVGLDAQDAIVGHTIIRIEGEGHARSGLVSTTYVRPEARQLGWGSAFLRQAHRWFRAQGVDSAATWTSSTNTALIGLYRRFGYAIVDQGPNDLTGTAMVKLGLSPLPWDSQ